ncbi:MAG: anti-sigma factor, partial [Anaerolineae bacterium]
MMNKKAKRFSAIIILSVFMMGVAIYSLLPTGITEAKTAATAGESVTVTLTFDDLQNLGADYVYEGWLIDKNGPVSAGRFTVDDAGIPSETEFALEVSAAGDVTKYILTIEPAVGDDPAPADTHLLAGAFVDGDAVLTIGDEAALGDDFTSATGSYILAVPTKGVSETASYTNGLWFLTPPAGSGGSLDLPTLPAGWAYEGWVVGDSGPVSTGTFTDTNAADSDGAGPAKGSNGDGPNYPGQDFINPLTDLISKTVVISVEPSPDNSPDPFVLKPLVDAVVEDTGAAGVPQDLANNAAASTPTGTASLAATVRVNWDIQGLENLGDDYVYEGWLIDSVKGAVSAGRFTVNDAGELSSTEFVAQVSSEANVGVFVLTIEPAVGDDPAPAATHILAGDFSGADKNNSADLTIGHGAALGNDFSLASGSYILAAPSGTAEGAAYYNGIWYLTPPAGSGGSLNLPTLPAGWAYEGWIVGEDGPVSTGTFTDTNTADSDGAGPTAGAGASPNYPGQDFVDPAVDLRGQTAVISIEPSPDNDPKPFTLKPLVDSIDDPGAGGVPQNLQNNAGATSPTGAATLNGVERVRVAWEFVGLEDLGPDYVYEGWLIDSKNGAVSAGRFSVDETGAPSLTFFEAYVSAKTNVSKFVLTIEPTVDPDPGPAATHVVAGDFDGGVAEVTIGDGAALGNDFTSAAGVYILAVPTDAGNVAAYYNGIWFLDPTGPSAGLDLPELPAGWAYEGWVVGEDGPVSTGTFTNTAASDSDFGGPTAGTGGAPPFPGQDFITPTVDLRGQTAVISIEPSPDNSPAPFRLKPLVHTIGDVETPATQTLVNNIANTAITGTISLTSLTELSVTFSFDGLEDLGDGWVYENWLIDNGVPVSAGRFTVTNATGRAVNTASLSEFTAFVSDKTNVSTFVLTIEPDPDPSPAPSDTHVIGGSFANGVADATIGHAAALGNDFTTASGRYILAAPSGADASAPYYNGIWYLTPGEPATAGLNLPDAPKGWIYEGWIVSGTTPISTGT